MARRALDAPALRPGTRPARRGRQQTEARRLQPVGLAQCAGNRDHVARCQQLRRSGRQHDQHRLPHRVAWLAMPRNGDDGEANCISSASVLITSAGVSLTVTRIMAVSTLPREKEAKANRPWPVNPAVGMKITVWGAWPV